MTHHVLHDVGGEDAKLRISDAYREDFVTIEEHYYARDDLAAALGLVTREDFDRLLEAREKANAALRAELDEAEATIARVRELTVDGDGEWIHRGDLRGALDPEPAFVLPTEAGAGICARIRTSHEEEELRLFSTGLWMSAYNGAFYTPEAVMDNFTGHRLIGAES